jgi:predicted lipid-binding transport protein (Tim44 family)
MQFPDFGTLFFFVAAAVIFYQLRSVLGKRTGNEKPPFNPYADRSRDRGDKGEGDNGGENDNVVSLPRLKAGQKTAAADTTLIDAVAKPGSALHTSLRRIREADPAFTPATFIDGAKIAYEMIVMAFDDGDKTSLRNLLSREVYDGFAKAIDERSARNERIQSSFIGVEKAEIIDAELKGSDAQVTLRIVSSLISATLNGEGEVIDGDPEAVVEVKDVWTFARDTKSRDPNWHLVATEAED